MSEYQPLASTYHSLADKAEAAQAQIEHEERVDGDSNPVLDHSTASKDADSCSQRPCY